MPEVTRYETTPDADPRHLYENVLVVLDAARNVNNGEPAALAQWRHASVIADDGSALDAAPFDAILVNAGATELLPGWLDALAERARLLVPLTVELPIASVGAGHVLRVVRHARFCLSRLAVEEGS